VDFHDHESAASALERFQGYKFDRMQEEGISTIKRKFFVAI